MNTVSTYDECLAIGHKLTIPANVIAVVFGIKTPVHYALERCKTQADRDKVLSQELEREERESNSEWCAAASIILPVLFAHARSDQERYDICSYLISHTPVEANIIDTLLASADTQKKRWEILKALPADPPARQRVCMVIADHATHPWELGEVWNEVARGEYEHEFRQEILRRLMKIDNHTAHDVLLVAKNAPPGSSLQAEAIRWLVDVAQKPIWEIVNGPFPATKKELVTP